MSSDDGLFDRPERDEPAIRVSGLSKRFRLGGSAGYRTFREAIADAASGRFRRDDGAAEIWALRDVAFEVRPGEVVGIIGRNGAGKSTLLKVLSGITPPTLGRVEVRGSIASLLEVGTGFHPELTGRENVYLNGAILGMPRREIDRKFDDIVAFAEVEKFIDTPVKRYSSGMQMRLAFAVAAHLEPDILVIDEVLAVGDAEFQRKCLRRMDDVGRTGRTVLFVSHQLNAVKALCSRAIQLDRGKVVRDGEPREVVNAYLADGSSGLLPERVWSNPDERPGNAQFRLKALRVLDADGELSGVYSTSRALLVEMEFDLAHAHSALCVGFDLLNRDGVIVFRTSHNDRRPQEWPELRRGENRIRCEIPAGLLSYGEHAIAPKVGLHGMAWILNGDAEVRFEMQLDHSASPFWADTNPNKFVGAIAPCLRWTAVAPVPGREEAVR